MQANTKAPSRVVVRNQCISAIDKLFVAIDRSGLSALCDDYFPKLIEWLGHTVRSLGFAFPPLACFFANDERTGQCTQFLEIFHPHSGSIDKIVISTPYDSCGFSVPRFNGCSDVSQPCGVLDALCQWKHALALMSIDDIVKGENRASESKQRATLPPARHSIDFRCVHWHGLNCGFTDMQAPIVEVLWREYENGTPDVGNETLLETVDAKSSRLVDIFRDHPAWGTMIVDGATKGTKRIADPPVS